MQWDQFVSQLAQALGGKLSSAPRKQEMQELILLDGRPRNYQSSSLYFAFRKPSELPPFCVVSEGGEGEEAGLRFREEGESQILYLPATKLFYAYNVAKDFLETPSLADFEARIREALQEGKTLEQILDLGSAYLQNPLVLTDKDFQVLACSSRYPLQDPYWKKSLDRGYFSYGFLCAVEEMQIYSEEGRSQVFPVAPCEHTPTPKKYIKLFQHATLRGFLTLLEEQQPVTAGQEEALALLAHLLEQQMQRDPITFYRNEERGSRLLYRLLVGARAETLERKAFPFSFQSRFCLLALPLAQLQKQTRASSSLYAELRKLFPDLQAVFHGQELFFLLPFEGENPLQGEAEEPFKAFLKRKSLQLGRSEDFRGLDDLPLYAGQARLALHFANWLNEKSPLVSYSQYRLAHLLQAGTEETFTKQKALPFLHPAHRELLLYDQKHGSDYSSSLRVYLEEGGSISRSAGRLHLHRNSIRYRLERLLEICPLSLEDSEVCFNLRLSYLLEDYLQGGLFPTENEK